jgi:hypothetical protein
VKAKVGDRIVVKGHHLGEPDRDALVLEVHSTDGGPPYVVRWSEDGHEGSTSPATTHQSYATRNGSARNPGAVRRGCRMEAGSIQATTASALTTILCG